MSEAGDDQTWPAPLTVSVEKICSIAAKADQYDAQIPAADPEADRSTVDADEAEETFGYSSDTAGRALRAAIEALSPEESIEAVALVWLGRGDYGAGEWRDAVALATERHTSHTADYLLGIPKLAEYLEQGLSQLGYSCAQIDAEYP